MLDLLRLVFLRQTKRLKDQDVANANFTKVSEKDFRGHYTEKILPKVKQYEIRRIEILRDLRLRIFIGIAAIIGSTLIGAYIIIYPLRTAMGDGPSFVLMGCIFAIGAICTWIYLPIKNYSESVKDEIFPLIFGFLDGGFRHNKTSPMRVRDLMRSSLIPSYDDEYPGDYVRGSYKDVPIELFEVKLTETRGSGKNRRKVTVFEGLFVLLQANKKFKGQTLIKKDWGLMYWAANGFQSLERVTLEDPVFERQFEVFSEDQVEARYLLTTSFMDRLLKLVEIFQSKGSQCSFYDSRLLIMIPTGKNYFETASVFKPATFIDEINTVLTEMKILFSIIDTLKLNEKTGL